MLPGMADSPHRLWRTRGEVVKKASYTEEGRGRGKSGGMDGMWPWRGIDWRTAIDISQLTHEGIRGKKDSFRLSRWVSEGWLWCYTKGPSAWPTLTSIENFWSYGAGLLSPQITKPKAKQAIECSEFVHWIQI